MPNAVTHADITAERDPIRGGITCAAMVDGHRLSERYYGYTMREARRAFHVLANGCRA